MVRRQDILEYMDEASYRPLTAEDLFKAFKIARVEAPQFDALLSELELEGLIVKTRYSRYGIPHKMNLIVGRLMGNRSGFAFLIPDDAKQDDVFIPANGLNSAMHGDRVMARLVLKARGDKKHEGEVIRVLRRKHNLIVGRFEYNKRYGFIVPDETRLGQDFFVSKEDFNGATHNDKVVAKVTRWPSGRRSPEAVITQVLGKEGEPGVDVAAIIHQHNLPQDFPGAVRSEALSIDQEIRVEDYPKREDLQSLTIVTIDGADAKDLDDAINVSRLDNGNYLLGVHIADVGHFVPVGSALDDEAYQRGTSVYFPDRVIPMLPPELSNGVCSLNPQVNRLSLSIFMEIDDKGTVVDHRLAETIINSAKRMTYDEVNRILVDKEPQIRERYKALIPVFEDMAELAKCLRQHRMDRGAIDFNFPEAKIILDEQGQVEGIQKRSRTLADGIIEEFMLKANETIAQHFHWLDVPFIYRVHEEPSDEKLTDLNNFLMTFNLRLKGVGKGDVHPKAVQEILAQATGRPEEALIQTVVLRSMRRAIYHERCLGHYGLAAEYYTHFTSPIRRYPDLVIHRIIKHMLHHTQLDKKTHEKWKSFVSSAAQHSTEREQVATEAERDVVDIKKVQFMEDKLGQVYPGIISGVIPIGFFVELENTVEGLVHISALADDYYIYDEKNYRLVGQRLKRIFRLGDRVKVRVARVDAEARRIDFTLHEKPSKGKKKD